MNDKKINFNDNRDLEAVYSKHGFFITTTDIESTHIEEMYGERIFHKGEKIQIIAGCIVMNVSFEDYVKHTRHSNALEFAQGDISDRVLVIMYKSFRIMGYIGINEDYEGNVYYRLSRGRKHHGKFRTIIHSLFKYEPTDITYEQFTAMYEVDNITFKPDQKIIDRIKSFDLYNPSKIQEIEFGGYIHKFKINNPDILGPYTVTTSANIQILSDVERFKDILLLLPFGRYGIFIRVTHLTKDDADILGGFIKEYHEKRKYGIIDVDYIRDVYDLKINHDSACVNKGGL